MYKTKRCCHQLTLVSYNELSVSLVGYEPADLTVHHSPFIFFVEVSSVPKKCPQRKA